MVRCAWHGVMSAAWRDERGGCCDKDGMAQQAWDVVTSVTWREKAGMAR